MRVRQRGSTPRQVNRLRALRGTGYEPFEAQRSEFRVHSCFLPIPVEKGAPRRAPFWGRSAFMEPARMRVRAELSDGAELMRALSYANTYNFETWFQSRLLHVYFNITSKDRSV